MSYSNTYSIVPAFFTFVITARSARPLIKNSFHEKKIVQWVAYFYAANKLIQDFKREDVWGIL